MTKSDISNARECANALYGHHGYMEFLVYFQKRVRESKSGLVGTHEHMAHIQSGRESAIGWLESEIEAFVHEVNAVPPELIGQPAQDPDLSPEHSPATTTKEEDPYLT